MVGDGINDTPAFAAADLSLAIGDGGADVTVEYADIVLQRGGIGQAANALAIGQETLKVIRESYALAIGLNGATLALTTLGALPPVAGALIHNLITVTAVAHAASLHRAPGEPPPGESP
jgi:P-type E1-E2 ATPase